MLVKSKNAGSFFFGRTGGFNLFENPRIQDFVGEEEGKKGDNISHLVVRYFFFLFPMGRNVDSISHLLVNFSTNSSFCQSALGMGLYTEGHHSEWLHSEFSVFRSLPREFYIAIFRHSDTQSIPPKNMFHWVLPILLTLENSTRRRLYDTYKLAFLTFTWTVFLLHTFKLFFLLICLMISWEFMSPGCSERIYQLPSASNGNSQNVLLAKGNLHSHSQLENVFYRRFPSCFTGGFVR